MGESSMFYIIANIIGKHCLSMLVCLLQGSGSGSKGGSGTTTAGTKPFSGKQKKNSAATATAGGNSGVARISKIISNRT